MITTSILFLFLASFVLYNTSKKAILSSNTVIERWIQEHTDYSKIIGCLLLIATLTLIVLRFGIGSGVIFWSVTFMSILSLIITISPLQKVNYKHLIILFSILLIIEFSS